MILGIGNDLLEVGRMEALLARFPDRARRRLFTDGERRWCDRRRRPAECFAARFAAKEACLKALRTGLGAGMAWRDVEVRVDGRGAPALALSGRAGELMRRRGGRRTHLSLTHDGGLAAATVVIES